MSKSKLERLRGYLGLSYRAGFLYHSSNLNLKIYKRKIRVLIVNRKIDKYLQEALTSTKQESTIPTFHIDIEDILYEMFGLININAIGISDINLSKKIKEILEEEEEN